MHKPEIQTRWGMWVFLLENIDVSDDLSEYFHGKKVKIQVQLSSL